MRYLLNPELSIKTLTARPARLRTAGGLGDQNLLLLKIRLAFRVSDLGSIGFSLV